MDNHRDNVASAMYENIHEAAHQGSLKAVEAFLRQGVDVNAMDGSSGKAPLHLAASGGHLHLVKYLLAHGADPNFQSKWLKKTPLFCAIKCDQMDVVSYLLQHGVNPNHQDDSHFTSLHEAIMGGNARVIFSLLSHANTDIAIKDQWGSTPLQRLINRFEEEKSGRWRYRDTLQQFIKQTNLRCLYAFLLKGIDVMQPELFDNDYLKAFRPKMQLIVKGAETFIAKAKEKFGVLGTPFVFHFLLSSLEERYEFSIKWSLLKDIIAQYNASKTSQSDQQWPLELSIQVYQLLWENADELFSLKSNPELPFIEEELPQRRPGF